MRLVTFALKSALSTRRIGVQILANNDAPNGDFSVIDLNGLEQFTNVTMRGFLERGQAALDIARNAVASSSNHIPGTDVQLLAPIYDCEKVVCIGMNYYDHCAEQNFPIPKEPVIFNKFPSCISGDGDAIPLEHTTELDWEVELAIVIGKPTRNVKAADAFQYIAGFTVAHDVSARDFQLKKNAGQWFLGKTFDGYAPIGPAIVTTDEINEEVASKLGLRCFVNGETVQDGNTSQIIFGVGVIVEYLSQFFTLKPGDLIFTGTPPGVGCFRKPPVFLKDGDVVKVEIDRIGAISNPVRATH